MNILLIAGGIIVVLIVMADVAVTTIAPHGAGKIARAVSRIVWYILRGIYSRWGGTILDFSGLFIILTMIHVWLLLLWTGYSIIFMAFPGSVTNTNTGEIATNYEIIYFVGYSLSTLGYGDLTASTNFLKILSSVISFTGLIMITTIVTFLVPVTKGALQKRKLSSCISLLGSTPEQMIIRGWNGTDFSRLQKSFDQINDMLLEVAQSHMAYPMLHYFHTSNRKHALPLNIVALDEALTILKCYVPEAYRMQNDDLFPLRQTIKSFLITANTAYFKDSVEPPPTPVTSYLTASKIPLNSENGKCIKRIEKRRKMLIALLNEDCWQWKDLSNNEFESDPDVI